MSSSSSDENDTTIHRSSGNLYTDSRAGSSRRHDVSDDEEHTFGLEEQAGIEADDAITVLLSSLHFEQRRFFVPQEDDDNELRDVHEKLFRIIAKEADDQRRRRFVSALPASNCLREQVYYLRRKPTSPPPSYFRRLNRALLTIVTRSFEESYRNVGTVLGVVEALAEVLILEVLAFGIPHNNNAGHHRSNRKLIANALTNLTFGQIHSKRRLCSYDGFISCVVRIILESPNITQVYAGLIRNLSWNADSGMSVALQPTVEALARAAVHAFSHDSDVTAILSALWNLAGHSVENKRTICDTPHCLEVLTKLLSPDAQHVSVVDSATGILKYVSQYLSTNSTHLDLRRPLISRMLTLLKSTSFTCVTNTLGAIANLIAKDPHMQQMIRQDGAAVQQLNVLRNSNRDDIRTAVKAVLNTLNQPGSHHSRYGDMTMSVGVEQMQTSSHHGYSSSPRLLSLRATRASPGRYIHQQQQPQMQQMQIQIPQDQRSCSLPRHFAMQSSGGYPVMAQSYNPQMMFHQQFQQQSVEDQQQMMFLQQQQQQQFQQQQQMAAPQQEPLVDEDLDIPTTTVMGTRSNSERSLGSLNPGSVMTTGGWNSTLDTAANSSRALSPVSFSDIPASPTMCAQVFYGANQEHPQSQQQQQVQPSSSSAQNTTHYSNGSANTMTRSSEGAPTMPIDNLITPTYALLNPTTASKQQKTSSPLEEIESPDDVLPVPKTSSFDDEELDYAIVGGGDEDLLARSIESEMPTSSSTPKQKLKVSPRLNGFFSPPLQKATSPWNRPHSNRSSDADRLLMESIMSEMPRSRVLSPRAAAPGQYLEPAEHRRSHSKNEEADRRDAFTASHEPSDQNGANGTRTKGSNTMQRMESLESQASSEDSFGLNGEETSNTHSSATHTMRIDEDDVDISIPMDCVDDGDEYDYSNYTDYEGDEEEDPDATQFDEGIDPHLTIDCSMISSGSGSSSLPKGETSRDSKALATSTPKGSTSSIQTGKTRRATRVTINGKSRLPVPKTNGSLIDKIRPPPPAASNRPRLPPKPSLLKDKHYPKEDESFENQTTNHGDETIYANAAVVEAEEQEKRSIYMNALRQNQKTSSDGTTTPKSSAIVAPYNYQKSPFTNRISLSAEINVEKPNPKQMLVTFV